LDFSRQGTKARRWWKTEEEEEEEALLEMCWRCAGDGDRMKGV
jgi:hypothetical protein